MKKTLLKEIYKNKEVICLGSTIMIFFVTLYTFFESGILYRLVMNTGYIVLLYLIIYFSLRFEEEITRDNISKEIGRFGGYNKYILSKLMVSFLSIIIILTVIVFYNYVLNTILFKKGMETEIYNLVLPLKNNIFSVVQLILILLNMFVISYCSVIVVGYVCKDRKNCMLIIIAIVSFITLYLFLRNFIGDRFPFYFNLKKMEIVRENYTVEKNLLKLKYYIYHSNNKNNVFGKIANIFGLKKKNISTIIFTISSGVIFYMKLINIFKKNHLNEDYNNKIVEGGVKNGL